MTRDIEIPSSAIPIYDSDATGILEYRVSDELVKLTLKGRADALSRLTVNDIKLSVSALGLGQGEHAVPLSVGLPNGIQLVGDYNVKLVISEASKDQTQ
jgi:YbbR domain-containing protein